MEPMNTSQNPIAAGSQMPPNIMSRGRKPVGPLAGAAIVIILIVAGGLYFWGATLNQEQPDLVPYIPGDDTMLPDETQSAPLESDASAGLPPQAETDDAASIESDFNAIDLDRMDSQNSAELESI